jgi:hypothetical protein
LKQLYDIAIDHSRVTKRTHHHGNENDPAITRLATMAYKMRLRSSFAITKQQLFFAIPNPRKRQFLKEKIWYIQLIDGLVVST